MSQLKSRTATQLQLAERVRLQRQFIIFLLDRADLKHLGCSGNRTPKPRSEKASQELIFFIVSWEEREAECSWQWEQWVQRPGGSAEAGAWV